jgi:glutathione S-transferase
MRRRFEINADTAANSRAKMVAAMDRLEREISPSGYLVGDSFTVADLTAAALFYPVPRPARFPYAMVADDDLPDSFRGFVNSLARRPGGQWLAQIYRRHRGASAELAPAEAMSQHAKHTRT